MQMQFLLARRYANAVFAVIGVRSSVTSRFVTKRLNVGSQKQRLTPPFL